MIVDKERQEAKAKLRHSEEGIIATFVGLVGAMAALAPGAAAALALPLAALAEMEIEDARDTAPGLEHPRG